MYLSRLLQYPLIAFFIMTVLSILDSPVSLAGCNIHGCSESNFAECNIHGCPFPGGRACNIHGCSESSIADCNIHGCPEPPKGKECGISGCPKSIPITTINIEKDVSTVSICQKIKDVYFLSKRENLKTENITTLYGIYCN